MTRYQQVKPMGIKNIKKGQMLAVWHPQDEKYGSGSLIPAVVLDNKTWWSKVEKGYPVRHTYGMGRNTEDLNLAYWQRRSEFISTGIPCMVPKQCVPYRSVRGARVIIDGDTQWVPMLISVHRLVRPWAEVDSEYQAVRDKLEAEHLKAKKEEEERKALNERAATVLAQVTEFWNAEHPQSKVGGWDYTASILEWNQALVFRGTASIAAMLTLMEEYIQDRDDAKDYRYEQED